MGAEKNGRGGEGTGGGLTSEGRGLLRSMMVIRIFCRDFEEDQNTTITHAGLRLSWPQGSLRRSRENIFSVSFLETEEDPRRSPSSRSLTEV